MVVRANKGTTRYPRWFCIDQHHCPLPSRQQRQTAETKHRILRQVQDDKAPSRTPPRTVLKGGAKHLVPTEPGVGTCEICACQYSTRPEQQLEQRLVEKRKRPTLF